MSKIAVLQPSYIPWLGFFEQMMSVDMFVLYDDAQYTKNDWRNRNRLKSNTGFEWLTIPVNSSTSLQIKDVKIDANQNWQRKHIKTITQLYSRAPFFEDVFATFELIWRKKYVFLIDVIVDSIRCTTTYLDIKTKTVFSSEIGAIGDKNKKLVEICKILGADKYYSGLAAQSYINTELFSTNGIEVAFQDYNHPVYPQMHGDFISHLSVIDLLFNCGKNSKQIIKDY